MVDRRCRLSHPPPRKDCAIAAIPTTHVVDDQWAYRTPHAWRLEFSDNGSDVLDRRPLLDRLSPRHPILDALMDQALGRILLTADGATMSTSARVQGGDGRDGAPTSGLREEIAALEDAYTRAKTHRARLRVIKEAQDFGSRLSFAPDRSLVHGTLEWRERIGSDPRSCRTLAVVYGVHYATISRIKKAARH